MWSKRAQTAGRGCRLSPSAPVDDPPPCTYLFIYFTAFPNKRSYNYSTPRAAHFNVNPTKKVERMKACWWSHLHAGSPLLCSTSQVRFASAFVSPKPPGRDAPVSREGAWNGSPLLWTSGWCLMCSMEPNMWCVWSGELDPHISSFCSLCWTRTFMHARAQASQI